MLVIRLLRLLALVLCLLFGLLLASTHRLLCRMGLSRSGHIHGFARLWYRSLLRVMNVRVRLESGVLEHRGLIVANHISWLDIPVLGAVLPTYFLAKAEVRDMPLVGWVADSGGTLFIHRGRHQLDDVRDQMQSRLGDGHFLTLFPEGTTGRGDCLRPFHSRLFAAAIDTGVPVVPVAIHYRSDNPHDRKIPFEQESFLTNIWRVLGIWRTDVDVRVLPAMESAGMPRRALANQAREAISRSLNLPDATTTPDHPATTPESQP